MDKMKLNLDGIKKILLEKIAVHGYSTDAGGQMQLNMNQSAKAENEIALKIDLVERLLELLRREEKHFANRLNFERFVQGSISIDADCLHYYFPEKEHWLGSGTPPIRLQTKLLLFLLLHHRSAYGIFDIIDNFISTIGEKLELPDFKKTKIGVTRCFTNTRFAANTLRGYGFLRYTEKEAYKTWILSLPGFLVASKVSADGNWKLPEQEKRYGSDLHPDIHNASIELGTYDKFVERLSSVCLPEVKVFKTFGPILERAYSLLDKYWQALRDEKMNLKERKKKSMELIFQLEKFSDNEKNIKDFYKEFSACINVENLLQSLSENGK